MVASQGANLKRIRESQDMNQTELAARIGVSRQTIVRWEKRKVLPEGALGRAADALGVSEKEILGEDTLGASLGHDVVSDEKGLNRWGYMVLRSDLPMETRMVIAAIGTFINRSIWAAPVSIAALADETNLSRELIERVWPEVLRSGWLERIGPADYLFRLKFKNADQTKA